MPDYSSTRQIAVKIHRPGQQNFSLKYDCPKTRDIYYVAGDYYKISEKVRLALKNIEDEQANKEIGIYKNGLKSADNVPYNDRLLLYSRVNDKHLTKELKRKIL